MQRNQQRNSAPSSSSATSCSASRIASSPSPALHRDAYRPHGLEAATGASSLQREQKQTRCSLPPAASASSGDTGAYSDGPSWVGPKRVDSSAVKTRVRVRLSVHYRVHSRQILCIGGSHIPLGWSFLSIAKVPMTWNTGDIWTCEIELAAGQRIEHKYTILEQQDWTRIETDESIQDRYSGLVPAEITYRAGSTPGKPPDVNQIMKQMAIVAWQPGPNRILQVPTEAELIDLKPGDSIERTPPRPANERLPYGQDPFEGTREWLTMDDEGRPLLERFDVWGWVPSAGARPADNLKGYNLNFGPQQQQ